MHFSGLSAERMRENARAAARGAERSDFHLTRFFMYSSLSGVLAAHDSPSKSCLAVSDSSRLAGILGLKAVEVVNVSYPEQSLLALKIADAAFDFCVSDQVFHHLEGNPFDAMRESLRVLRPGGFAVHTTAFINPVYRTPPDFWRFTPEALALMCQAAEGIVVGTGAWGNKEALALIQIGLRRIKVPLDPAHPLHQIAVLNDPEWPIVTWLVAQKPFAQ